MGDVYILLDSVQFRKRYFQHRNKIRIKSDQGWKWLIIPLARESLKTGNKQISNIETVKDSWREEHLRAIKYAYSRTPYFSDIFSELEKFYDYDGNNLTDFNTRFIKYAFKKFKINIPMFKTSEMIKAGNKIYGQKTDLILTMCHAVEARTFVSGPFGKTYLDREAFKRNNITLVFQKFEHPKYSQIHGEFLPNMSFIDLLFNHGPKSIEILGKSDWEVSK